MENKDYYHYYEILFSLRKEYLKNQELINILLSNIKVDNDLSDEYSSSLVFKPNHKEDKDSLLLLISKRQSYLRYVLSSLFDIFVYGDPDLDAGKFLYEFRLSEDYAYLLDGNQDGRYLDSKIDIVNQKEFIEAYKKLMENVICKHGNIKVYYANEFIWLGNNGILLSYFGDNDRETTKLEYDGFGDNIITNNTSYIRFLMDLKIKKDAMPVYFRNLIDSNMEDYLYSIEGSFKGNNEFYTIEDESKKLVLKPNK